MSQNPLSANGYSGEFGIENKATQTSGLARSGPEFEIDLAQLSEPLTNCIHAVRCGQVHLVLDNGKPVAAVVSMPDYIQLSRLKALIENASVKLLQCQSLEDTHRSDGTGETHEDKSQTGTAG